MTYLVI